MGVPWVADAPPAAHALGPVTACSCCSRWRDTASLAELAYRVARAHSYDREFTVLLAASGEPKVLRHDRPLAMRDINSGATWAQGGGDGLPERLIVLWRRDSEEDFHKVLIHELVHLCAGEQDEARTKAAALDLWCVWKARTADEHASLRASVAAHLRALSAKVAGVDAGETNAARYWSVGACMFLRDPGAECAVPPRAPPSRAPPETFTVLPEGTL
jgi:hypothetical protein